MANEPQDPITHFAAYLAQQPALKVPNVPVFPWRQAQAKNTSARRIVVYPTKSATIASSNTPGGICDIDQHMAAECWGNDGPTTWALLSWLVQALYSQSVGPREDGSAGYYMTLIGADWETDADTGVRGQVVTLLFSVRFTVESLPFDIGHMGNWPKGQIDATEQTFEETS